MAEQRRGHLKIFFGYAPGVGKTCTMLKEALVQKNRGKDVVIGYLAPDIAEEACRLAERLENLGVDPKTGRQAEEFNLDAAIERKPELLLVDQLAHVNKTGSRHTRRYQDVEELLRAGIDVYTTANAQNMESLHDVVSGIMKNPPGECVPDFMFDQAECVEFVDMDPEKLFLQQGTGNVEELTVLRKIAIQWCEDREKTDYDAGEHILVCLSASPSSAKIIRTASRLANAFHGGFTALYVKTPEDACMSEESSRRLQDHIHLAEQLGAKVEVIYSNDIPFQIAEFACLSGASKIVIGRSAVTRRRGFGRPTLTEKLVHHAPQLDVYIIPDADSETTRYRMKHHGRKWVVFSAGDIAKSMGLLLAASLIGYFFDKLGIDEANIITVYVLSVLLTSLVTKNRIYSMISSIVSVLVFNFLFTEPKFSLKAYDAGYPITFAVMFLAALITGSLVMRLKSHARQSAGVAFRTRILFDTNRLLQKEKERDGIISVTVSQLIKLLGKDIVVYMEKDGTLGEPQTFPAGNGSVEESCISEKEREVALWTFQNNKHAGATTDTFSAAKCLYLALRVNDNVYGVIGIVIGEKPLEAFENSIFLSVLGECAMALENEKNIREKEEAAVLAQNEQLRANLLRAISHDLRTPLTSISGNAGNLMSMGEEMDPEIKQQLYTDIYEDSMWLINMVENLLSTTRLVGGQLNLNMTEDLIEDVITEALQHINKKGAEHQITVECEDELLLAKMDSRLIVQVIINLVNNAIQYTRKGSHIHVLAKRQGDQVTVSIADDGSGIPDEEKKKVFDMFYSGESKIADSRRSCGIGLSLCRSIIKAHGGEITITDNIPHGAVFTFTLPAEEVRWHE